MTKISRNDIFSRPEKGGEWFEEFLRICHEQKSVLDVVVSKKSEGVDDVVKQYREMVGLDLVKSDIADENTKVAQAAFLSIRHAIGPIAPMKLKKLTKPDEILKDHDDSEIVVQIKYDGFKTQAIRDLNGEIKLYTRRGEDFTKNVPELVSQLEVMPKGSFFLGELVWEKDGKQSISDIQTVVGSSPEKAHEKLKEKSGKPIFYVYDLLWEGGKDITKEGYMDRYNKLKKILGKGKENLKLVSNFAYSEKDEVINTALKANAEGIVLKPKDSEYKYANKGQNEPHGEWAKFKPGAKSHTDEVILKKYSKGENKLVFTMYQYKGEELFEVGKLSGMSKEDESKIKKDIDDGKIVIVEITFQERMPSGKFRHVGWSRFRSDKPAKEVKYSKSNTLFLSIKQAQNDIVELFEKNPEIKNMIDSFCQHSGGTKSTNSIINRLREKLGNELVRFSDKDLINYIEERKHHYKEHLSEDSSSFEVGMVGTDPGETYEDNVADYITHG